MITKEEAVKLWLAMSPDEMVVMADELRRLAGPWEEDPENAPSGGCRWVRKWIYDTDDDPVASIEWLPPEDPESPDIMGPWGNETIEEWRAAFEKTRKARPVGWFDFAICGTDRDVQSEPFASLAEAMHGADAALHEANMVPVPSTIDFAPPPAPPLPWATEGS